MFLYNYNGKTELFSHTVVICLFVYRRAQNHSMRRLEGNLRYDMTGMSDELETEQSTFLRLNSGRDIDGDRIEEEDALDE